MPFHTSVHFPRNYRNPSYFGFWKCLQESEKLSQKLPTYQRRLLPRRKPNLAHLFQELSLNTGKYSICSQVYRSCDLHGWFKINRWSMQRQYFLKRFVIISTPSAGDLWKKFLSVRLSVWDYLPWAYLLPPLIRPNLTRTSPTVCLVQWPWTWPWTKVLGLRLRS